MKRVNTFEVVPQTENVKECLLRLLDASASLWNELTYERRQNYFGDGDVWDTSEYRGRYNGVVGSANRPTGHAKEQRSVAVVLRPQGKKASTLTHRRTGATKRTDANSAPISATTSTRFGGEA